MRSRWKSAGWALASVLIVLYTLIPVAWIASLTLAFCVAYYQGGQTLDPKVGLSFLLLLAAFRSWH